MYELEDGREQCRKGHNLKHDKKCRQCSQLFTCLREIGELNTDIGTLTAAAQDHAGQLAARNDTIKKMETQYTAQQQADAGKIGELQRQVTAAVKAKEDQMKDAVAEARKQVDDRDKRIMLQAQEISDQQKETTKLKTIIAILKQQIRDLKRPTEAGDPLAKADGKIAKVLPEQGLCYINLGRKDGVQRGLPFAVYPARAVITEKGAAKARIIVVSVHENTSECRIVLGRREDPVTEGDLIANLAFDTTRVYKFVVEGGFDLYGRGRPDPLGNSRIKQMIQQWGAKIVDTVTVDTDFVVMGAEPVTPPKPAADAPAQEWEVYRQEMKKYQHFRDVREAAGRLHVQILNTTRFLAYSGVVPKTGVVE